MLNGHDHNYQRWAPMTPDQALDPKGIREFVVGDRRLLPQPAAVGRREIGERRDQQAASRQATSVGQTTEFGMLKLTLHPDSYDFRFTRWTDGKGPGPGVDGDPGELRDDAASGAAPTSRSSPVRP